MPAKTPNQRIKAEKIFTDRVEPRDAFNKMVEELKANPEGIFVLSYYGIGGIGKTRLLEILSKKVQNEVLHIKYDFHYATSPREVIMSLRNLLMNKGFAFHLLDAAEKEYIEKSGKLTERMQKQDKRSSLTDNVIDLALEGIGTIVPGTSLVVKGFNAAKETAAYAMELRKDKPEGYDVSVQEMRHLEAHQILDSFPEYFARDLEFQIKGLGKPIIIMLDTYEKLVDTYCETGHQAVADHWLREQIVDMVPGVMWVIAGRERLDWAQKDSSWEGVIDEHRLGDLGEKDCQLFLDAAKIPSSLWKGIYELTEGTPAFLDICVEEYYILKGRGYTNITMSMLAGDSSKKENLLERFVRYMNTEERELAEVQAIFGVWRKEQIEKVCKSIYGRFNERIYNESLEHSIIYVNEYRQHYMHEIVRKFIVKYMATDTRRKMYIEMSKVLAETEDVEVAELLRCVIQLSEAELSLREFVELYERFSRCGNFYRSGEELRKLFFEHLQNDYMDSRMCKQVEEKYHISAGISKMDFYLYEALWESYGEKDILTLRYMLELGVYYTNILQQYRGEEELDPNLPEDLDIDDRERAWMKADLEWEWKERNQAKKWAAFFMENWYVIGKEIIGFQDLSFVDDLEFMIDYHDSLMEEAKVFECIRLRLAKYQELLGEKSECAVFEKAQLGYYKERYGHTQEALEWYCKYIEELQMVSGFSLRRNVMFCSLAIEAFCKAGNSEKVTLAVDKFKKLAAAMGTMKTRRWRDLRLLMSSMDRVKEALLTYQYVEQEKELAQLYGDAFRGQMEE